LLKANISGSRIKQARKLSQMDQIDLAAALEIEFQIKMTQSDISEIERGVRGVKDYELYYISKILNVNPIWLLTGDDK
jgi:transcriptional regulator with XRE-family HTH domain